MTRIRFDGCALSRVARHPGIPECTNPCPGSIGAMRGFSVSALLVALLFVAGCGGGGGGGSNNQSSGEATKSANQVVKDAVDAAEAASSVHVAGQIVDSGEKIGLDLTLVRDRGATGTATLRGAKVDVVLVGGSGYLRAGSDFWKQVPHARFVAPLLADKWLKIPADNAQFGAFVDLGNDKKLFDKLKVHGKLKNQGATTYKGQSVVAIYDPKEHTTLYVAAAGTPYPVAIVKTQQPKAGALNFDGWNKSVTLSAPKGALDLSQFGG